MGGQDSCCTSQTCKTVTTVSQPVKPVSPCERCSACVASMNPAVAAVFTQASLTRFDVSDTLHAACQQYFNGTLSSEQSMACSQLRKAIRERQGGLAGKRAGLVCSLMGECNIPAGTACNITASSTAAGSLSLCTVEGVEGGMSAFPPPTFASNAQSLCESDGDCSLLASTVAALVIPTAPSLSALVSTVWTAASSLERVSPTATVLG